MQIINLKAEIFIPIPHIANALKATARKIATIVSLSKIFKFFLYITVIWVCWYDIVLPSSPSKKNNKIYILWSTKELINHKSPSCSSDSQWFGTAPQVAVSCQPQSWTTPENTEGIMSWMKPCSFYRHVIQCNLKGPRADKLSLNSWGKNRVISGDLIVLTKAPLKRKKVIMQA